MKNQSQAKSRARKKQVISAMKLERGACADCGLAAHTNNLVCFDWDHRDPTDKRFGIADARAHQPRGGIDALLAEIAKCDLVCANCHRLRTFHQQHHLARREIENTPSLFD